MSFCYESNPQNTTPIVSKHLMKSYKGLLKPSLSNDLPEASASAGAPNAESYGAQNEYSTFVSSKFLAIHILFGGKESFKDIG